MGENSDEEYPRLQTERLHLRPFTLEDAPGVARYAADRAIADTTLNLPHPYEESTAREWIGTHADLFQKKKELVWAVTLPGSGEVIGAVGLRTNFDHSQAEMGYWIGKPFWNRGYCTEAARAVLAYAFEGLELHRVFAHCFTRNPGSGRVLEKIGMAFEGHLRDHILKWGVFEDLDQYGVLRDDWEKELQRIRAGGGWPTDPETPV